MSKSSTATASKIAPQLPQKSAWSRGPPSSTSSAPTPRSQSPAPNATPPASATHSRRPSALGQGVSFKEGVGAARSPTNTVKAGSAVTFGSIDDVSAPISSSPASVPPIKTEGVKSFGTVPATPTSAAPVNGKPHAASSSTSGQASSSSSTPAVSIKPNKSKFDVKKLFQNAPPSSSSSPSTSDMTSPPSRPSPLPHPSAPTQPHAQPQHQHPPQFGQQFSTFVPSGLRPQQNGTSGTGQGPPRSPVVYSRQPPNVAPTGVNVNGRAAPQGPQGGPPLPPAMPSPRMGPPSGQPTAMSPAPWGYYATPYAMDPQYYYAHAHPQWGMMPQQSPGGGPPAHPGMPVSPRNPPPQLHPPGTPTMSPAVPAPGHPPHNTPSPHIHTASLSNITSPPATPSSSSGPGAAGSRSMRTDVPAFVPKRSSGVVIKDVSGHEVGIEKLKENAKRSSIPPSPASPARPAVRLESDEQRRKRLAEEERKKEEEAKAKSADKALLRIDTAVSSTTPARPRPGPLDLSSAKGAVAAPLPSALATARIIDDLQSVPYPDGILSPKVELNVNAKEGKFRYDREFLLQFMAICKDKPDNLPPLDVLGINPQDQPQFPMTRTSSGRRQPSVGGMGPPAPRTASVGLGIGFGGKPGAGSGFTMGQFSTPANKMTSEERFNVARSTSVSGPPGMPFGRQVPMVRSSSQGGPGGTPMGQRTRSRRGEKRGGDKSSVSQSAFQSMHPSAQPLEPVAPLEASANRWTPASIIKKPQAVDENSPEVVERKVKSLLNKLTMERFDSISDQIIQWANKSEAEKDGRTLIQVIKLVFEKATDEATWSEMYARLCRKMMEQISNKVQDDGIRNAEGKPIAGGQLFRKYLLNRCQEDFERGWIAKEATAAAAATKATEDQAAKAAAHDEKDGEIALYSEEYYAAQKAKRQGLGLVKFIGELFKLQMLTERIMHECIKKLLSNVDNPEEEEIESLCKLMTTVGQLLDTPKARAHMDVYFTRMKELVKSPHVNSRMQFMLQDVIEMRERKWIPRSQAAAPTTIAAVHEAAAKEKAASDKDSYQRTLSMSRGGSRRGGDRDQTVGPDGWVVTGTAVPRAPPKAGDLSNFGKISKTASMSFGPSSVFNKKEGKPGPRDSTISRTGSVNMFSMLSQNPELASETLPSTGKSSRPPSRKASIDLGHAGAPEAPLQRRKLNLLPRSVPKDESKDTPTGSAANSEDEHAESGTPSMSEAEAKKKIDEDSKEFFSIRDLDEAEVYFTKLPVEHRHLLIDKLVTGAIESKEADSQLVADLFHRAFSKNLCSPATFEEGFTPTAEILDDIAIDAPKAFQLFATMLKGAGLDKDEERCTRIASKSTDSDKLLELLS
ncbi:unnamed protein product [Somion occarium]|uniref:MI domain-containing protein n=1 Tax=Somion occarium TaxID=3059160 RepID=A0ABP1DW55_9APHY